jgi:hypothetical protein
LRKRQIVTKIDLSPLQRLDQGEAALVESSARNGTEPVGVFKKKAGVPLFEHLKRNLGRSITCPSGQRLKSKLTSRTGCERGTEPHCPPGLKQPVEIRRRSEANLWFHCHPPAEQLEDDPTTTARACHLMSELLQTEPLASPRHYGLFPGGLCDYPPSRPIRSKHSSCGGARHDVRVKVAAGPKVLASEMGVYAVGHSAM